MWKDLCARFYIFVHTCMCALYTWTSLYVHVLPFINRDTWHMSMSMHTMHFLLYFCMSLAVCVSCVWCFGVTPIVSGYECVLAEAQQWGHLIVVGAGSSYSLPSCCGSRVAIPGLPRGASYEALPFQRDLLLGVQLVLFNKHHWGALTASIITLWDAPLFSARRGGGNLFCLQSQDLKSQVASDNVQRARPSLTERVNAFIS